MYKIIEAFLNKESHHINLLLLPFDTKGHLARQSTDLAMLQHHRQPNQSNQPRAIIIMCLSVHEKPDNVLCNATKWARFGSLRLRL